MSGGSTTTTPPPTPEETELTKLNAELAQAQLDQINTMAPFQQELMTSASSELARQSELNAALDAAVTPEQQAQAYADEFARQQAMGPIQDELLQLQLEELRRGGAATPEQLAAIEEATNAGITAGSADIDVATSRGIGMIADELANSRGLRLSDTPILREATLLSQTGMDQKSSLTNNLRAAQANAALNYPLAVQQLQGAQNIAQQNVLGSAQQFQNQLRQQAYQNRLSMTGQAQQGGIGLASIGPNQMSYRNQGSTTFGKPGLADYGALASGIGAAAMAFSDSRLKVDYGKVAETKGGIGLHLYRYKGDPVVRVGVMADDVEKIIPEAVKTHSSGFKVVDYGKIR